MYANEGETLKKPPVFAKTSICTVCKKEFFYNKKYKTSKYSTERERLLMELAILDLQEEFKKTGNCSNCKDCTLKPTGKYYEGRKK